MTGLDVVEFFVNLVPLSGRHDYLGTNATQKGLKKFAFINSYIRHKPTAGRISTYRFHKFSKGLSKKQEKPMIIL